jgi:hypothetical protein
VQIKLLHTGFPSSDPDSNSSPLLSLFPSPDPGFVISLLQAFQLARDSCFSPLARATSASRTGDSPHLQLLTYNIQARYGAALCALSQLRNEDPGLRNPKTLEGSLVALGEIKGAMGDAQLDQEELYWLVLNGAFFARGALHNRTRIVLLTKSMRPLLLDASFRNSETSQLCGRWAAQDMGAYLTGLFYSSAFVIA